MNMFSIINVNFQNHWTANVQMAVAQKLCVQKPIVMDTISIECVFHALCMANCCDKEVSG